jgi:hypothetical protein
LVVQVIETLVTSALTTEPVPLLTVRVCEGLLGYLITVPA